MAVILEQICHSNDFFIVVNNKIVHKVIYEKEITGIGDEAIMDIVKESVMAATHRESEDIPIYVRDWTEEIDRKMVQEQTTRHEALRLILLERGPANYR